MKKISSYLVVMLGFLIGIIINVQPVKAATLVTTHSDYFFNRSKADGSDPHSWNWDIYDMDGEVSYCIEPNVHEGTIYNPGTWEETELPNEIKERLLLIGYYGYTYPGHQTLKYRAATQGMIWDIIVGGGANTTYSTERWGAGTPFDVSAEKAEINRLIDHHYDRPSFNGQSYKVQKGETLTLTDTNNVLDQFDINVSGAEYSVEGNKLTITPTASEGIDISFIKKTPYSSAYKLFIGNEFQNMLVPGTTDPVIAKVSVNSYGSSVEGHKKDSETGTAQGQATLEGAEYGIYETATGKLVTTVVTDENGYFKSDPVLESKDYYLQEIEPSEGYYLDKTRYNIDVRGKESVTVDVVEKVIKNYISILKQYEHVDGETKFLNAEEGITFEIYYPNGDKYGEITTDENGYATINLPYGVWRFHQVNTTSGYEKVYDFYITVSETSSKEQYYNILNNALSSYLQVVKVDEETGKTIAIADTTFKILNTDTSQYVSQYVGGKVISEFKTDKDGILVTPLKLEAGNYKLIEVSSPKGYLIDKKGINFTIGNDTHYNYTTYGAFITVTYKNTPIKGQLEIRKEGEVFAIEDGNFIYKKKKLSGVTFEIYAAEDILSSDGNYLYYNKGDLVETITTNKDGYAISKKLPLGKYYFVEVKTQDEYVLDDQKHYFTLKEVDDETAIVYESYSALNYLKKGTLEFSKKDLVNGDAIPNTVIEVYTEKDELIFTGTTDENGKVTIPKLKVGKYYIVEKEAATGYVITTEKVYFEIKENGEIVKAEMTNKPITGTLEFTKTDVSTGDPLPNTLIEIYNEKDELIFSGRTDENGKITIPELRYGKYYIVEKEAPEGYTINPERMYFEILEDGEVVKATMTDEQIKIEVPNTDLTDSHLIEIVGSLMILGGIGVVAYVKKKKSSKKD